MSVEYRVVWQREGSPRAKERRYVTMAGAQRRHALLASDPHGRCHHQSKGYDDPPHCIWSGGYEVEEPSPFVVAPRIERREVGPWEPGLG